jgi:uncharacterized membrane protein YkgB
MALIIIKIVLLGGLMILTLGVIPGLLPLGYALLVLLSFISWRPEKSNLPQH